ncbi:hypothetical protein [Segniliparus rugosus]|uniref:Uncharacterized protein n=1 Tax=Segniliparus rugosus (strain ATCC BAA-974 / DSM 45345 / CCUG 50838 / CIP 108380 / JCM 13579 / CDC 945) TaxID=679197 RepID=E5XRE4_SEGRC|nr:hypothetical protein [Segniliparus rugosus]EFV13077.1 hypothetical protein HMPREF9336_02066 [Segniliparus rugosus ATCC BAA-974]
MGEDEASADQEQSGTPSSRPRRTRAAGTETFLVVVGFCLLLLHNDLYYGDDFVVVLISALVLIPVALFQLARFVFKKSPPGPLRTWRTIATPAILVLTFLLVQAHAPRRLGWLISKTWFEEAAAEIAHDPGKAHGFPRLLGLYWVESAAVNPPSDAVYFHTGYGVLDTAAFVRIEEGTQPDMGSVGACHPLDESWQVCTNDLNGE